MQAKPELRGYLYGQAVAFLGEPLNLPLIAGTALIVTGLAVSMNKR